jgi:hypothetical protein
MSTHPNVILMLEITPDDLARKTWRGICDEMKASESGDIKIEGIEYHSQVMEDDYDEGYQISSKEGVILLHDLVTYGYGEKISWDKLNLLKESLEKWAIDICNRYKCSYVISVSANYW